MADPFAFKKGVLLAETYEKVKPPPNPTGWWMSEKLDGVRAYWNGNNFYSRNGLLFDAPPWFKEGLPAATHLDGELWCGREQFERCVGIIKYHKGSTATEWKHLVFLCFDAPVVDGEDGLPYEKRHEAVEQATASCPYAAAVGIRKCTGAAQLEALLKEVLSHGGEGLMLREPGSRYARARSKSLLKVKAFTDAEAKVVGHTPGKNRLTGMLGALQCEMPLSGHRFEIGTGFSDAERNLIGAKKRWPAGSVVTYKYQNITAKGVPRFPVFLRARTDKTWGEVVADAQKDRDDAAAAAAAPLAVKRAPSLMAPATGPAAAAAASAAGASAAAATAATPPPILPVRRSSSDAPPLWTEGEKVESVAAAAASLPAASKSKARLDDVAEPRVTRTQSQSDAAATAPAPAPAAPAPAAPAAAAQAPAPAAGSKAAGKRKRGGADDGADDPAARWRAAVREGAFDQVQVHVGKQRAPPRANQQAELAKWAQGKRYDREWLLVGEDGAPAYFEAMDGKKMRLSLAA